MAFESIPTDISNSYIVKKKQEENTITGCSIEVTDTSVFIMIPINNENLCKRLQFSKADMRKLLEELFVS